MDNSKDHNVQYIPYPLHINSINWNMHPRKQAEVYSNDNHSLDTKLEKQESEPRWK